MKESTRDAALAVRASFSDNTFPSNCPTRVLLDHVSSRWGVLVLVLLAGQQMRWSELRRAIEGVSEKMLAQTLRTLEADGLVIRTAHPEVPPRVDYRLSSTGEELAEHLVPLMAWVVDHAGNQVRAA